MSGHFLSNIHVHGPILKLLFGLFILTGTDVAGIKITAEEKKL